MGPFSIRGSHGLIRVRTQPGVPFPLGILYIAVKNKAGCVIPIIQTIKTAFHQPINSQYANRLPLVLLSLRTARTRLPDELAPLSTRGSNQASKGQSAAGLSLLKADHIY